MDNKFDLKGIELIYTFLQEAHKHNLTPEEIMSALKYMNRNPTLTIEEVINAGSDEWIK